MSKETAEYNGHHVFYVFDAGFVYLNLYQMLALFGKKTIPADVVAKMPDSQKLHLSAPRKGYYCNYHGLAGYINKLRRTSYHTKRKHRQMVSDIEAQALINYARSSDIAATDMRLALMNFKKRPEVYAREIEQLGMALSFA